MLSRLSINSTGTDQEWTGVTKKLETSTWANLYIFHMSHRLPLSALQIQAYLTWFLLKSFLWIFSLLSQKGDHTQTYTHIQTQANTQNMCPFTRKIWLHAHVLLLTSSADGPISAFCPSPSTIRSSSWEIPVRDSPTEQDSDWNYRSTAEWWTVLRFLNSYIIYSFSCLQKHFSLIVYDNEGFILHFPLHLSATIAFIVEK